MTPGIRNAARRILGLPTYVRVARLLLARRAAKSMRSGLLVADAAATSALIRGLISASEPSGIGKIGATELRAALEYLAIREGSRTRPRRSVLTELHIHSGVFPPTEATLMSFVPCFIDAAARIDLLVAWHRPGEQEFFNRFCRSAKLIDMAGLDPFFLTQPWTAELAGKAVLVASPFVDSISHQYKRRNLIWAGHPGVLPEFDLHLMRVPLSDGLVKSPCQNWFEAFDALLSELRSRKFDVLLVGAGAFSLPLVAAAKEMGRIGIHLGGSTQIIFGIRGARWDVNPAMAELYNQHWIRPSSHETPVSYHKMEAGCYW